MPTITVDQTWRFNNQETVSIACSPSGERLYLGQLSSRPRRLNLIVDSVADGRIIGIERMYRDKAAALPPRTRSSVEAMLCSPRFPGKLYLATPLRDAPHESGLLTVYDVDAHGEPAGEPVTYDLPDFRFAYALALHPHLPLLYVAGNQALGAVAIVSLDPGTGAPLPGPIVETGVATLDNSQKYSLAFHPSGARLYLASTSRIQILPADGTGRLSGPGVAIAATAAPPLTVGLAGNALYWPSAGAASDPYDSTRMLMALALDAVGDPAGEPTPVTIAGEPVRLRSVAYGPQILVDAARGAITFAQDTSFEAASDGHAVRDGLRLVRYDVTTHALTPVFSALHQAPFAMGLGPDGQPLLVMTRLEVEGAPRTTGHRLRLTVLEVEPSAASGLAISFNNGTPQALPISGSPPSTEWISLDAGLEGATKLVNVGIHADRNVVRLRLRAEISYASGPGGPVVALTRETEVEGDFLWHLQIARLLVPGYAADQWTLGVAEALPLEDVRRERTQFLEGHARRYPEAAQAVGLLPWERPRGFVVSCDDLLLGDHGSLAALHPVAEAMALLGFNTAAADHLGPLSTPAVNRVLREHGIRGRMVAAYNVSTLASGTVGFPFDFALRDTDGRARQFASDLLAHDYYTETLADLVDVKLKDEPGWYYPPVFEALADAEAGPFARRAFVAFLRRQGLSPGDLGSARWDDVAPLDLHADGLPAGPDWSAAVPLASRRLFYWTMRFFAESAARGFREVRESVERVLGGVRTFAVTSNTDSRWYRPAIFSSTEKALGGLDWFLDSRLRACTPSVEDVGAEDELYSPQDWAFYADLLRSVSALGDGRFEGYVRGNVLGAKAHDAAYKVLAWVGRGGKNVDVYTFGPEFAFGDGWSERFIAYAPIADALRLLGRGERLLLPGVAARGQVAILYCGSSDCWDEYPEPNYGHLHTPEVKRLHYALVHAGYDVDFVDETDLVDGALELRGYRVLYATAPGVRELAHVRIEAWVRGGGTLVVTPSALVADEYDSRAPATTDAVLGLQQRPRTLWPDIPEAGMFLDPPADTTYAYPEAHGIRGIDPVFAEPDGLVARGPLAALMPTTATVVATSGGAPAITVNAHGSGQAVAYAFFPGLTYWLSAVRHCRFVPTDWGPRERTVLVAPVRLAGAERRVRSSVECVQVCRLDSPEGLALVLLNWNGYPIRTRITVPQAGGDQVSSVTSGLLRGWRSGNAVEFDIDLEAVDVVLIPERDSAVRAEPGLTVSAVAEDSIAAAGNRDPTYIAVSVTDHTGAAVTGLAPANFAIDPIIVGPGGALVSLTRLAAGRSPGFYLASVVPIGTQTWRPGVYVFTIVVEKDGRRGQALASVQMD